jgi:hypothetical protein
MNKFYLIKIESGPSKGKYLGPCGRYSRPCILSEVTAERVARERPLMMYPCDFSVRRIFIRKEKSSMTEKEFYDIRFTRSLILIKNKKEPQRTMDETSGVPQQSGEKPDYSSLNEIIKFL